MCGEHQDFRPNGNEHGGSSPHVRGALGQKVLDALGLGIIPACAGSTRAMSSVTLSNPGSSPHVRGALVEEGVLVGVHGIIPACAGSTLSSTARRPPARDHPRMCGEHSLKLFPMGVKRGIIPACAGSTLKYLAFLGYSSAFSFGSQGSKLFTCVVFYPPNFRAL